MFEHCVPYMKNATAIIIPINHIAAKISQRAGLSHYFSSSVVNSMSKMVVAKLCTIVA